MDIKETVTYLQELRENNNKAWFDSNRPRYDNLRSQFQAMVAEVISQTSSFDPSLGDIDPAQAMFRINRDIRFSKDKTPYKVAFSAMLVPGGKGAPQAGYYLMIHADDELIVGAGIHEMDTDRLAKFRKSVVKQGKDLQAVINKPAFAARFGGLEGEKLKNVPKEFPADHPYAELLKHKSVTVGSTVKASDLNPDAVAEEISSKFEIVYPFVKVIREFMA